MEERVVMLEPLGKPRPPRQVPTGLRSLIPLFADALAMLEDGDEIVVSIPGTQRYVQVATFGDNLRIETVGNAHLSQGDALEVRSLTWLASHGWNEPDGSGNHWCHLEPADHAVAATLCVVTLHLVHGVTNARWLTFTSTSRNALDVLDDSSVPAHTAP